MFELFFLVIVLILACGALVGVDLLCVNWGARPFLFSLIGGFLGGWAFDTKWFYRVTARGKDNQHAWKWEQNKIYWRLFIPFVSAIVAVAIYAAGLSGVIPLKIDKESGAFAFSFSFLVGYFSDTAMGKMADSVGTILGKSSDEH